MNNKINEEASKQYHIMNTMTKTGKSLKDAKRDVELKEDYKNTQQRLTDRYLCYKFHMKDYGTVSFTTF